MSQLQTSLSNTTISGYVNVTVQFSANVSGNPALYFLYYFLAFFHRAG